MGSTIVAKCDCGYESKELFVGAGRMNYEKVCLFPHLCQDCQTFFNGNIYEEETCPLCRSKNVISYDDKRACRFMEEVVFSWNTKKGIGRNANLSLNNNLCPKCGKYKMLFLGGVIMWD